MKRIEAEEGDLFAEESNNSYRMKDPSLTQDLQLFHQVLKVDLVFILDWLVYLVVLLPTMVIAISALFRIGRGVDFRVVKSLVGIMSPSGAFRVPIVIRLTPLAL